MSTNPIDEHLILLTEIRDLLRPIADAYVDSYNVRQQQREESRLRDIEILLSTEQRKRAWALCDGTRTQREIAQNVGMNEGNASRFFKSLRDLGGISATGNPKIIKETP